MWLPELAGSSVPSSSSSSLPSHSLSQPPQPASWSEATTAAGLWRGGWVSTSRPGVFLVQIVKGNIVFTVVGVVWVSGCVLRPAPSGYSVDDDDAQLCCLSRGSLVSPSVICEVTRDKNIYIASICYCVTSRSLHRATVKKARVGRASQSTVNSCVTFTSFQRYSTNYFSLFSLTFCLFSLCCVILLNF